MNDWDANRSSFRFGHRIQLTGCDCLSVEMCESHCDTLLSHPHFLELGGRKVRAVLVGGAEEPNDSEGETGTIGLARSLDNRAEFHCPCGIKDSA